MRKLTLFAVVLLLAFTTYAYAADSVKIGYIDMQGALNESLAGKDAKAALEKLVKERQDKIDEKIALRDKLTADLEKQSVVLSDDAKRQKEDELDKLNRELDRMVSDSNTELQKQQREMEIGIIKDLDTILKDIGKKGNYTVILPAEVVLYSVEGIDVTDEAIKKLDEIYKKKNKK